MDGRIAFLNGGGHNNDHSRLLPSQVSRTNEAIRLENPRPKICRNTNDYTHVLNSVVSTGNNASISDSRLIHGSITHCPYQKKVPGFHSQAPSVVSTHHKPTTLDQNVRALWPAALNETQRRSPFTPLDQLKFAPTTKRDLDFEDIDKLTASLSNMATSLTPSGGVLSPPSIICPSCGKCRCADCAQPRKLPSTYLCGRTCLCSSETVVDCLSCACCLKGCLYHAGLDDGCGLGHHPCPSTPPCCHNHHGNASGSLWRGLKLNLWKALCLVGACLFSPCLWCYLPLRGCAKLCSACYARHHDRGCRCTRRDRERNSYHGTPSLANSPTAVACTIKKRSKSASDKFDGLAAMGPNVDCVVRPNLGNHYVHLERRLLMKSYSTGCDSRLEVYQTKRPESKKLPQTPHPLDSSFIGNGRTNNASCRSDSLLHKIITGPP